MLGSSQSLTTSLASSTPPFPPFAHTSERITLAPTCLHLFITKFISESESVGNLLTATTVGKPYTFFIFERCLNKFGIPFSSASKFSLLSSDLSIPPCIFKALIVATKTTQEGFKLANLHFISKNFSAPRSAPNPASVTA